MSNFQSQCCWNWRQVTSDAMQKGLERQTMRIVKAAVDPQRHNAGPHWLNAFSEKFDVRFGVENL